jgi:hypothetical protein
MTSVLGLYRAFPLPDPPAYSRPSFKPSYGICCFTTTTGGDGGGRGIVISSPPHLPQSQSIRDRDTPIMSDHPGVAKGKRKDLPHTTATVRLCRVVGHRCPSAHDSSDLQAAAPPDSNDPSTRMDLPTSTCRRGPWGRAVVSPVPPGPALSRSECKRHSVSMQSCKLQSHLWQRRGSRS